MAATSRLSDNFQLGLDIHEQEQQETTDAVVKSVAGYSKRLFDEIDPRATIAMPKHHEKENVRVLRVCEGVGAAVQICDYYHPEINPEALNQEVDDILSAYDHSIPIPQAIIAAATDENKEKYPTLRNFKAIADKIVSQNFAVILPGGISIHPKFYGEEDIRGEKRGFYDFDPRRTILDFFLINACKTTGTPLLGICRGHQIINVYHGGTLDRDSIDEIQLSKIRESASHLISTPFKAPSTVFFNHRQTVTKIGEGLQNFMHLNALKDLDDEKAKLGRYFDEAEGTIAAGREMYVEIGAEEIYDRASKALEERAMMYENLEKMLQFLEKDHIVMAAENQFGAPLIGVQFHPEDFEEITSSSRLVDKKGNIEIFRIFALMAKTAYQRQAVLGQVKKLTVNRAQIQ